MLDLNVLLLLTVVGIAVGCIALTATRASITAPLRVWLRQHAWYTKSKGLRTLSECPYCFAHWGALVFVVLLQPLLIPTVPLMSLVVSLFYVVAVSALSTGLIALSFAAIPSNVE